MDDDAILMAIRAAWEATIQDQLFDPDRALIETGADSLMLMQLGLRLEQALRRKIPYDLLLPQTTPRSLAASLVSPGRERCDLPQIFFLAGLGGDNGMLPTLREAFAGEIRFTLAEAPGLDQSDALLSNLAATAAWIAANVSAAQPGGNIRLAGYSIGGIQAFETARHLMALGRNVSLLCLFDAVPVRGTLRRLIDALRAPSQLLGKVRARLPTIRRRDRFGAYGSLRVDLALRVGAYGYASKAARVTAAADAPADYGEPKIFRLWAMRVSAALAWRPLPLNVPTVLVLSEDGARWAGARFWKKLITPLTIVRVRGTHDRLAFNAIPPGLRDVLRSTESGCAAG